MNPAHHLPPLAPVMIMALLLLLALYRRWRRNVGRQVLRPRRPWLSLVLFTLITFFMALALIFVHKPLALLVLLGGVGVGAGLGAYGLRLTRFEATPDGLYYTPNAHIGIALTLLFIARVVYRSLQTGMLPDMYPPTAGPPHPPAFGSPFTMLFFGPLAGYYITYAIGLLRWRSSIAARPVMAQPLEPR